MSKAEKTAKELKTCILSGDFSEKLPPEKELAVLFGLSPNTVGKAVRLLAEEGLVTRRPGHGTFVRCPQKKRVRVAALPWLFDTLSKVCAVHFPDVELVRCGFGDDPHITTIASFSPLEYNRYLDAMPEKLYAGIAGDYRFFSTVRDLHRIGRICYGIPAFFSPVLIAWNKELMKKVDPHFNPLNMTLEKMTALIKQAARHGISGIDVKYFTWHTLTTVLANLPGKINWNCFEKSRPFITSLLPFFNEGLFEEGNSLFTLVTRHLIRRRFLAAALPFEIMPIPFFGKTRRCNIASEALAVTLQAPGKELLWKIALLSLDEDFQRMIAEDHHSIPLDRALAVETLDTSYCRDDIFFSEIRNIDLTSTRLPFQVMREIALEFSAVVRGKTGIENFYGHIQKTYSHWEYESMRDQRIRI